ncbi:MAG: aspartate--tRNA ligase [Chloroflexi bacterium]|nr:aspartate--tRNA ligase [Chloroflexota bacterium]
MLKEISCGSLNINNVDDNVVLAGWVNRRRDHGNLIFIDLRDRGGLVQIVFNSETDSLSHANAEILRNEWVIQIKGKVIRRSDDTVNKDIPTGEIEIHVTELNILNESLTPPFYVNEETDVDESVRLQYRYIDLRRENMKTALITRHKVVKYIRDYLDSKDFLEIETPILIKSTPEGARDHIVPSRLFPGNFYALPQSPQQLKQLLMVAGVERYFQIAKCFRDEDSRADRQPEFTQLDLEMSFVSQEDILTLTEELFTGMMRELFPNKEIMTPFPRFTYEESISMYGIDRPDLRYDLKLFDLEEVVKDSEFKVFQNVLNSHGVIRGFSVPGCATYTRRQIDELTEFVKSRGATGLISIGIDGDIDDLTMDDVKSNISRFLTITEVKKFIKITNANSGDLIFIIAGEEKYTNQALGALRHKMGDLLGLADPDKLFFAFVTDFPLFEWNEDDKKWHATHHAFCMPKEDHINILQSEPGKVIAESYDLICNGLEMASGSIRVHQRDLQERIFEVLGYSKKDVADRFAQLLDAFEYGAPPHGGIAPGIDRLIMVLLGKNSIRDVIAFPKTQSQMDPLFQAPSPVEDDQLKELKIKIIDED